jgi:hypothetical protein
MPSRLEPGCRIVSGRSNFGARGPSQRSFTISTTYEAKVVRGGSQWNAPSPETEIVFLKRASPPAYGPRRLSRESKTPTLRARLEIRSPRNREVPRASFQESGSGGPIRPVAYGWAASHLEDALLFVRACHHEGLQRQIIPFCPGWWSKGSRGRANRSVSVRALLRGLEGDRRHEAPACGCGFEVVS